MFPRPFPLQETEIAGADPGDNASKRSRRACRERWSFGIPPKALEPVSLRAGLGEAAVRAYDYPC